MKQFYRISTNVGTEELNADDVDFLSDFVSQPAL